MPAARILQEVCVAETREVALDEHDRPIALRLKRLTEDRPLQLGRLVTGRLRSIALAQGGGFVQLDNRAGDAFIRLQEGHGLTEGQALELRVVSEPRDGHKLARVALASKTPEIRLPSPWGTARREKVAPGNPVVAQAFDTVLSNTVTLPGGGHLTLERTRALIAVDVDTFGRSDAGRPASRALKVNLDAAAELARQIRLRNLGGLIVMDCISPINRDSGKQVRDRFDTVFRGITDQYFRVLEPTDFGLLQASIEWSETPMAERLIAHNGEKASRTVCFDGFRLLERAAMSKPMDRLRLDLPGHAHAWLCGDGKILRQAMAEKYGDRFIYESTNPKAPSVYPVQ